MTRILVAALVAATLLTFTALAPGDSSTSRTGAESGSTYEFDVLPGVQSPHGDSITPRDLTLNCGWHGACDPAYRHIHPRGIDIDAGPGTAVYVTIRAALDIPDDSGIETAEVDSAGARTLANDPDYEGCKRITVKFVDNKQRSSTVTYVHVIPMVAVGYTISLPTKEGDIVREQVAMVAHSKSSDKDASVRDGKDCLSTGPHLHQEGNVELSASTIWRNIAADDETGGFPSYQFVDPPREKGTQFCSDTWIFKIRPSAPNPRATAIAACPPKPATPVLTAEGRNGRLELSWTNRNAGRTDAISHYEVRWKEGSGAWGEWQSAGDGATTSHTLSGLKNGTSYTVGLRAVSTRLLRSAPGTDSATPVAPPTITPACTEWGASLVWRTVDGNGAGNRSGSAFRTRAAATAWLNENVSRLTRDGTRNITHSSVYCMSGPVSCSSWTSLVRVRNTATGELIDLEDTGFPTEAHAAAWRDATVAIIQIAQIIHTDVYCGTSGDTSSGATGAEHDPGTEGTAGESAGARVSTETRAAADAALADLSACLAASRAGEWACLKAYAGALDTIHGR